MSLTGLATGLTLILAFLSVGFMLAMPRLSDHPRYKHWCGIGAYCSGLGALWVIVSLLVVLFLGMTVIRGSVVVASALVFLSAIYWPHIEQRFGYGPKTAVTATPAIPLDYAVALHLIYTNHRFQVYNDGKTNLSLWGSQMGNGPQDILREPRIISPSPTTYYFIPGESFEKECRAKIPNDQMHREYLNLFLTDALGYRHVARFILLIQRNNAVISVDTQLVGLEQRDWGSNPSLQTKSVKSTLFPWPGRESLRKQVADLIKNSRQAAELLAKTPDKTFTKTLMLIAFEYLKPAMEIRNSVRNIIGFPAAKPLNHLPTATTPAEFRYIAEVYERLLNKIPADAPATTSPEDTD